MQTISPDCQPSRDDPRRHFLGDIYARYALHLIHALEKLGPRSDAEDCVHSVFAHLLNSPIPVERITAPYLLQAVRRKLFREYRREKRRTRLTSVFGEQLYGSCTNPDCRSHTDFALNVDTDIGIEKAAIEDLLGSLPPRCSAVVQLRSTGLSYDEIACRLAISPRTVDAQLQRAKKLVKMRNQSVRAENVKTE